MNIILLDKIANLGSLGDQVAVKSGYARNFLFPQGKAVPATKENVELFEQRRADYEAKLADQLAAAQARAEKVNALESVTIASKAGDEGKLFGSVTAQMIADAIAEKGFDIDKKEIEIPEAIKTEGSHYVDIKLNKGFTGKVKVKVKGS